MTLLVEPDPTAAAELRSALGQDISIVPTLDSARAELEQSAGTVVTVVGPSIDSAGGFRLADEYRVSRPALGVVLVRRRVDTALLTEALRSGVRDVVEARDLPALNRAVRRAQSLAADLQRASASDGEGGEPPTGKVVTVFSAKGGCGKTTISTNLASLLAASRRQRVCLVDLDLAFGDVAIALQLQPSHSIADAVAMNDSLDADGLLGLLTRHTSGVHTLTAPVGPELKDSIKPELVTRIIDLLRDQFDVVVVDTPPAFDDTTLAAFDRTDLLLMLTTPDVPAIKNLKLSMETLALIGFPDERVRVVVNRADAKVGLSLGDIETTVRHAIAARVPSSRDVPAATNRGVALTVDDPRHPVSVAIGSIATDPALVADAAVTASSAAAGARPAAAGRRVGWLRAKGHNR